jgi:hypothetical protein
VAQIALEHRDAKPVAGGCHPRPGRGRELDDDVAVPLRKAGKCRPFDLRELDGGLTFAEPANRELHAASRASFAVFSAFTGSLSHSPNRLVYRPCARPQPALTFARFAT